MGISRNEVARRLKVSARTVSRMVDSGELTKQEDGTYDPEEVESILEAKEDEPKDEQGALLGTIKELVYSVKAANEHSERMLQLVEKPMNSALMTVTSINQSLLTQLSDAQKVQLETMQALGEMLMMKDERKNNALIAQERAKLMRESAVNVTKMLPKLAEQFVGKNKLKDFLYSLNDEERAGIFELTTYFEGDKGQKLKEALESFGISAPRKADNDESGNQVVDVGPVEHGDRASDGNEDTGPNSGTDEA